MPGLIDSSRLEWSGTIVTFGGGFSSIRGLVDGSLTGATELQLRIRTDGRAYELLADDDASTRVTHYNPIPAVGGDWEVVVVPLTGMESASSATSSRRNRSTPIRRHRSG